MKNVYDFRKVRVTIDGEGFSDFDANRIASDILTRVTLGNNIAPMEVTVQEIRRVKFTTREL